MLKCLERVFSVTLRANSYFFDFKADFRIEYIPRDLSREMIHPKRFIEVCHGGSFDFGESSNTQYGRSIFMMHDEKSNYSEFESVIEISSTPCVK